MQLKYSCIRFVLKTLKKIRYRPILLNPPFLRTPLIFIENVTSFHFLLLFGHPITSLNKGAGFPICISLSEKVLILEVVNFANNTDAASAGALYKELAVLKNFVTRKNLCWSLFFNKVAGLRP